VIVKVKEVQQVAPLIGILASVMVGGEGLRAGVERCFVSCDYIDAVLLAGGTPVILPVVDNVNDIRRQLQVVNGLLVVGGDDVDPILYGEEPLPVLGPVFPERDRYELMAMQLACEQGKPILGICRGAQIMNVAFGGTLDQEVLPQTAPLLQHYQNSKKGVQGHTVELENGSLLDSLFAQQPIRTNSYHHQAIRKVAPGFIINARTSDGVIEGIENRGKLILGVQWHPEMMVSQFPAMLNIFKWLIDAAKLDSR